MSRWYQIFILIAQLFIRHIRRLAGRNFVWPGLEVGTAGELSTTVKFFEPLPAGTEISAVVWTTRED